MSEAPPISPAFVAEFLAQADTNAAMTFERFMALALYAPEIGYYRRNRKRVGYEEGTDFYTASTSGTLYGELIAAACTKLLEPALPGDFTFVEIGAESEGGVLSGVAHPFKAVQTIRVGGAPELTGKCVVFSNELFDAQPFRRFVFRNQGWKELGVMWRDNTFVEIELGGEVPTLLPPSAVEGYIIDAAIAATALAQNLVLQPWSGLFVAADYGKAWAELIEACPRGTARAYHRHQQSNDLLAQPSEQDLTCHVCWDWLSDTLTASGFRSPVVESQEAFLVHHAGDFIARATTADAATFSRRKMSLLQLLHPAHLGQKFQVLHGRRD